MLTEFQSEKGVSDAARADAIAYLLALIKRLRVDRPEFVLSVDKSSEPVSILLVLGVQHSKAEDLESMKATSVAADEAEVAKESADVKLPETKAAPKTAKK